MRSSRGYSAIELLVVLGMTGIFLGMAISNLRELDDPLLNATSQTIGFLKQVRARAFATTSAYTITPTPSGLVTSFANRCSDVDTTSEPRLSLTMPSGVTITDTSWTVCFSARGLPNDNVLIPLQDHELKTRTVEVMLGGAVRIVP